MNYKNVSKTFNFLATRAIDKADKLHKVKFDRDDIINYSFSTGLVRISFKDHGGDYYNDTEGRTYNKVVVGLLSEEIDKNPEEWKAHLELNLNTKHK